MKNKQTVHGERIEEIRKDRKLSQRELAAQAGISYDALRRVENGETNTINSDMLIRLAEFFEVSTDYLLGLSNIRERRSYAVSQLGLSEESAKRLVSRKIDPDSLNLFLGNERFAAITQLAKMYLLQRTLDGVMGMNAIMDYAIEGMKNASVTDPEAKRERVRHITALQGMKSQGNNAGRDQMERLFSQMLTEMEKAMDVRTNMQTTANDEMVLGIYDNLKGKYISVTRDDIEIIIDPESTGKISDIQKRSGFLEYVKPGRVTLNLYVGGKHQNDKLDVYCAEDASNQLSLNNQKDMRMSWKWAEDRYEVELTFDKVKNLPNPEFYDVGYIIRTQEYQQMRGGTQRIDTYGEPVTNQYRVGTADRKHTANVRVEMNERAVVSMYIKSRYDDSVFVMTDWEYITSCASTYWFEKAKEYNTKADSWYGEKRAEAGLWNEEFSDLEIMDQIEKLPLTYGAWLNFNERLLDIFYGVPPIIIETADQLASIAKKENKDFEDICTVLSITTGVSSKVQDEAIKNLVSATLECTMNIDRVETELVIDMGKFVYEAAKGAIGAFDSPYAAMKYVVGELDKNGELKLKDEKVYIVYEVFGLNGMEIELELQSVADYATYTLVKDALQAKKAYGNAKSLFMVKEIEKLETLEQILDNHFN